MKRIIVLLLVMISFGISYGEELSAKQKQLAWKFIYENMLSKEYLPLIFHEDIIVNLKGEIKSEDSIVVKDIITDFQKAIPHLKIVLSGKEGNLVLGLNNGKDNRITTNVSTEEGISSQEIFLPVDLSQAQRKPYIYYHLFRGLIFRNKTQKDIPGLRECVYVEKDYQSITYSPFDLFILEKLYAPDFSTQLANNLPPELQETAWSLIRTKIVGKNKKPIIYRDDIVIQVDGNFSHVDSAIMDELIDQLKLIIPNRKINLTSEKANLIFNYEYGQPKSIFNNSHTFWGKSIKSRSLEIFIPQKISKEEKRKTIYFHLIRSMVKLSPFQYDSTEVPGSVFDESNAKNISYHPIDSYMLNTIYADDFHEQFKNKFIQQFSYRLYLIHMYHNELDFLFFLLGLLIPAILLTRLIIKGSFKAHNWNWKEFNKQGLYLIAIGSIFAICFELSDLKFDLEDLIQLLLADIRVLFAINLIYIIEKTIFKNHNLGGSKIIIIFVTTFFAMNLFSFKFDFRELKFEELSQRTINDYFLFINILIISLARSLYNFLNDRYKSIINQKDVELAQMSELHKQAELQSLRAKINPHFLYNALNSIASLATTDGQKTEQMALSLSDFFKYAINREQKQLNTLSEELNAIRTYLEIEKVRFGERLDFEIDCPIELLDIHIPQLLIQPLVENALKHGLSQITDKGFIKVAIRKEGNQLKIRVYDNGPAFPEGPLSGFGIQNTQERITLIYGSKAGINWQNEPEKYIEISLPL